MGDVRLHTNNLVFIMFKFTYCCFWLLYISFGLTFLLVDSSKGLEAGNWASCQTHENVETRVDTVDRVEKLRKLMLRNGVDAYIIPSADVHLGEFVSDYDKRRQFISGFTGSSGTAVVTVNAAALWTDGRYFLHAESQLGCDWILMREGEPGVPTLAEWLGMEAMQNIGASPYFFSSADWLELQDSLMGHGALLKAKTWDYIDQIWVTGRQGRPSTPISVYSQQFAGRSWEDKVSDVRKQMEQKSVTALIITSLDETAWMFNLRGSDITGFVNDPFFYSFAIIERKYIRLYISNHMKKLAAEPGDVQMSGGLSLREHLNTGERGDCPETSANMCVQVEAYDIGEFSRAIQTLARQSNSKLWLSYFCNYAFYSNVQKERAYIDNTPVAMLKAKKNAREIKGMQNSHIRDAAALARLMTKMEQEVRDGIEWTEVSAAQELQKFRSMQNYSRGDSFSAISSVGPHAAINHYFPTNETDRPITMDETYLLDSGGQYLDGTTDITRTFLFREPSHFEKECYTRVLMGQINLAMAVWNKGLYGREIDAWARQPLLDVGLVYRHGTGHGIGHYLSVHEGPGRISNYHAPFKWDVPLEENMFFSDEPGYYQDGEFGIRLENIVYVKHVETKYKMAGVTMLGMETVTLFPYEPHMIDLALLTEDQISWLNVYNKRTLGKVGSLLKAQNDVQAYNWLESRTRPIKMKRTAAVISAGTGLSMYTVLLVSTMLVTHLVLFS